jgi:hypothetical protein
MDSSHREAVKLIIARAGASVWQRVAGRYAASWRMVSRPRRPVAWTAMSTRRLILAALLCGMAILVAFTVQILVA